MSCNSRTQLTKDVTSDCFHNEAMQSIQLPVTHIKSPNEICNLSLLISRALTRYAISYYSYQEPRQSAPLV